MELSQNTNRRFSIYPSGWWDEAKQRVVMRQLPQQSQLIEGVFQYITSDIKREATLKLRDMEHEPLEEQRRFKLLNFEYATFSGVFSYRNASSLLSRSPYIALDIDNLASGEDAEELRDLLAHDREIETALCFVSPRGRGVKWIVELPTWCEGRNFREQFDSLRDYVGYNYGIDPDRSGSDVCRACFLSWDSGCYVHPKYLI